MKKRSEEIPEVQEMEATDLSTKADVPFRRIAEAYKDDGGTKKFKKYGLWMAGLVLLLFLSSTDQSSSEKKKAKRAKNLRSKAENLPASMVQSQAAADRQAAALDKLIEKSPSAAIAVAAMRADEDYDEDEEKEDLLDEEIEDALTDVAEAEEEEIEVNDSMLVAKVRTVEDNVKFYLGRVFGYGEDASEDGSSDTSNDVFKISEKDLDIIAEKISSRLESDVRDDFRKRADIITEEKIEEIEVVLEEDSKRNMGPMAIAVDVVDTEQIVVEDLMDEIDEAAVEVSKGIKDKADKIRNQVVMEVTGRRMDDIVKENKRRKHKRNAKLKEWKNMVEKKKQEQDLNSQGSNDRRSIKPVKKKHSSEDEKMPRKEKNLPDDERSGSGGKIVSPPDTVQKSSVRIGREDRD